MSRSVGCCCDISGVFFREVRTLLPSVSLIDLGVRFREHSWVSSLVEIPFLRRIFWVSVGGKGTQP